MTHQKFKSQPARIRRRKVLSSRPKLWSLKKRYLSAGRALQALVNVTRNCDIISYWV